MGGGIPLEVGPVGMSPRAFSRGIEPRDARAVASLVPHRPRGAQTLRFAGRGGSTLGPAP